MSQEDYEIIEKYFDKTLEGEALKRFEKRMVDDPQWAIAIEEQRVLNKAVEEEAFRTVLDDFHEALPEENVERETRSEKSFRGVRSLTRYAIAAAITALLIWGGLTFLKQNKFKAQEQNEQLFATHFQPDPGLPTTMSSSSNFLFFEAMVFYKQGDYEKAITKWNPLLKEKPKNDTLNYFIGVAHLANNNEDEAITFLQWASEHQDSRFLSDIYHYLGLAHLKTGDKERAQIALEKSDLKKSKDLLEELTRKK